MVKNNLYLCFFCMFLMLFCTERKKYANPEMWPIAPPPPKKTWLIFLVSVSVTVPPTPTHPNAPFAQPQWVTRTRDGHYGHRIYCATQPMEWAPFQKKKAQRNFRCHRPQLDLLSYTPPQNRDLFNEFTRKEVRKKIFFSFLAEFHAGLFGERSRGKSSLWW